MKKKNSFRVACLTFSDLTSIFLQSFLSHSTQISAATTITPSPGAVESSIASVKSVHGVFAEKPELSSSAYSGLSMPSQLVTTSLFLIIFFYLG